MPLKSVEKFDISRWRWNGIRSKSLIFMRFDRMAQGLLNILRVPQWMSSIRHDPSPGVPAIKFVKVSS